MATNQSGPLREGSSNAATTVVGCILLVAASLALWSTRPAETSAAAAIFPRLGSARVVVEGEPAVSKEDRMKTKAVIEGYFAGLRQKKGWDSFLAEDMVFTSFTSPVKQVTGKAAYLEATKRFYGGIVAFEVRDVLVEGDKACALTRYQLQRPGSPAFQSDVAEVFQVRDGKIVSFDIYFDTAPFPK